jgi:hypothetical protein
MYEVFSGNGLLLDSFPTFGEAERKASQWPQAKFIACAGWVSEINQEVANDRQCENREGGTQQNRTRQA